MKVLLAGSSILLAISLLGGCSPRDLYRSNPPGRQSNEKLSDFSFSPDGQTIGFTYVEIDRENASRRDTVGFMDLKSGEFSRLHIANDRYTARPSFSPDGEELAFEINFSEAPGGHRLALLNMESMRYRFISRPEGEPVFRPVDPGVIHPLRKIPTLMARNTPRQAPAFSPDGKRLFYVREMLWKETPSESRLSHALESVMRLGKSPKIHINYEIWEMDLQSGDEMKIGDYLTTFVFNGAPRYYGNDKIVFSTDIAYGFLYGVSSPEYDKYESHYVFLTDLNNPVPEDELKPILTGEHFPAEMKIMNSSHPNVSADGTMLVRIRSIYPPGSGLALWDGREAKVLLFRGGNIIPHALSLDGRTAVVTEYDNALKYWLMDVASGETREFSISSRDKWRVTEVALEKG